MRLPCLAVFRALRPAPAISGPEVAGSGTRLEQHSLKGTGATQVSPAIPTSSEDAPNNFRNMLLREPSLGAISARYLGRLLASVCPTWPNM